MQEDQPIVNNNTTGVKIKPDNRKKYNSEEFSQFVSPFFKDIDEETIDFLQRPHQQKFNKSYNKHELNLYVSVLKPKRKKSEDFINSIVPQPSNKVSLRKRRFITQKTENHIKLDSLIPEQTEEIERLKQKIEKQNIVVTRNKELVLAKVTSKIPIMCHKKIQLAYDHQIICKYKQLKSYLNKDHASNSKPFLLRSMITEKLEYLNLFDIEELQMKNLQENEEDDLASGELGDNNKIYPLL